MPTTPEDVEELTQKVGQDPNRVLLSYGDSKILDEVAGIVRENLGQRDYAEFLKTLKERLRKLEPQEAEKSLNLLHATVKNCSICPNMKDPSLPIWNRVNPEVLLVSKTPLSKEDGTRFLVQTMKSLDLDGEIVGATSVARCEPAGNKIDNQVFGTCAVNYLYKEITAMAPTLIVTLGSIPFFALFGRKEKVNDIVGVTRHLGNITVIPTYDPSYALRSERRKQDFVTHIQKIKPLLDSQDE